MSDDSKHLSLANLVYKNQAFQDECKLAKDELYGLCIEAIKQKDYTKADALNAACEALQTFFDRFRQMSERYAQLSESEEDNSSDESYE